MATIAQILPRRWPGQAWTISADDYASLIWHEGNTAPLPTEAEIRAFSVAVDLEIAGDRADQDREGKLMVEAGALLKAFDILVDAISDARVKLQATALTAPLDVTVTTRLNALRQKINAAKA